MQFPHKNCRKKVEDCNPSEQDIITEWGIPQYEQSEEVGFFFCEQYRKREGNGVTALSTNPRSTPVQSVLTFFLLLAGKLKRPLSKSEMRTSLGTSGKGWPVSVTSIPRIARAVRMCPVCGPSFSSSSRLHWLGIDCTDRPYPYTISCLVCYYKFISVYGNVIFYF